MTLQQASFSGRKDGWQQKGSAADHMKFDFEFPSKEHWNAYMTAFYRGCGYPGVSNRSARKNVVKS